MMFKFSRSEKGQSIIVIAIIMVVLIALIALVVDIGHAYAQLRIAHNAADASALAATLEYSKWLEYNAGNQDVFTDNRLVRRVALDYAEDNGIDPAEVTAIEYTDIDGLVLGMVPNRDTDPPLTISGVTVAGVQVSLGKHFDTFFAGVIGRRDMDVSAKARAVVAGYCEGNIGLFPIAVDEKLWKEHPVEASRGPLPVKSKDYTIWDHYHADFDDVCKGDCFLSEAPGLTHLLAKPLPVKPTPTPPTEGEGDGSPDKGKSTEGPGNFGWIRGPGQKPDANTLRDNITNGMQIDWKYGFDFPGTPGVTGGVKDDTCTRLQKDSRIIVPIYDKICIIKNKGWETEEKDCDPEAVEEAMKGGGENLVYNSIYLAAFDVQDFNLKSTPKCFRGRFTGTIYTKSDDVIFGNDCDSSLNIFVVKMRPPLKD